MPFPRIRDLIWKDWKLFFSDRQSALLCFAVPILLASAFGAIFYRADTLSSLPRLPIYLVVEDETPFTKRVIATLQSNREIKVHLTTQEEALSRLADKETGVVVVLPRGFGRWSKKEGNGPQVLVHHQPNRGYEGRWAEGVLTEAFLKEAAKKWMKWIPGFKSKSVDRPFQVQHSLMPSSTNIAAHAYSHAFCGMTLQYLLFWGMDGGLLLLRERKRGIWHRMRAAPLGLGTLFIAKLLSISGIALLQIATTFSFGRLFFGVEIQGGVLAFGIMALSVALLAGSIGLLVAAIGGTESRARSLSIVTILALSMLGGMWMPSFMLPKWAQDLSHALPTTWASKGFASAVWRGHGINEVLPCAGVVLGTSIAFVVVAFWRFRCSETRSRQGD